MLCRDTGQAGSGGAQGESQHRAARPQAAPPVHVGGGGCSRSVGGRLGSKKWHPGNCSSETVSYKDRETKQKLLFHFIYYQFIYGNEQKA